MDNLESKLDELIKVYGEAGTRKHLSQLAGFAKEPPTITEFLEEDYFAGRFLGGHRLWPCWKETLGKIYGLDNPYGGAPLEICLSGGIGIGKSTCALAGMLYDLTRLLHLRSIQEHFSLLESTGIVVAFMNNTQKLAESNLFRQFNTWIQQSPFFQEEMNRIKQRRREAVTLPQQVELISGSRGTHVLGSAVVMGVLSELNFQGGSQRDQAYQQYTQAKRRMESRFERGEGHLTLGRLWLDSSRNSQDSWLEQHLQEAQADPNSVIISMPIWEAKKHLIDYGGERFSVFVGTQAADPKVLEPGEQEKYGITDSLVVAVPTMYRKTFDQDVFGALRDVAGISTWSSQRFFSNPQRVRDCLTQDNPCNREVIELSFKDPGDRLINYVDLSKLDRKAAYALHLDIGIKHCRTGIALTRQLQEKKIERIGEDFVASAAIDFCYSTDLLLAVVPRPGEEVSISKLKNFVIDLRNAGIHISSVTADSYQSTSLLQDLKSLGFKAELLSLDKTKDGYYWLKNCINEDRFICIKHRILEDELLALIEDDRKIDKPPATSTSTIPSKDCSDAVAGSLFACGQQRGDQQAIVTMTRFFDHYDKQQSTETSSENTVPGQLHHLWVKTKKNNPNWATQNLPPDQFLRQGRQTKRFW